MELNNICLSPESTEYQACTYQLNHKPIMGRMAKITPQKIGQFVTLWKRTEQGTTTPFTDGDNIDLFVINVQYNSQHGQFVFPRSVLLEQGIITGDKRQGKRGFRVYPAWDHPINSTAKKTQKWQLEYFLTIRLNFKTDLHRVRKLFANGITASTD
ncbi:hypothetical protein DHD08_11155 [Arenibacter sp. H213]|nr:hypothetical protein [Arenibacter sp. H213]